MKVIKTVSTPNLNALKFYINQIVVWHGSRSFVTLESAQSYPVAKALFEIPQINSVLIMKDIVTVNKNNELTWDQIIPVVADILEEHLAVDKEDPIPVKLSKIQREVGTEKFEQIQKINLILDDKVRPALAGDGGGIEVLDYTDGVLSVHYEGACGSCPSASEGTLDYIERTLKESFSSEVVVVAC